MNTETTTNLILENRNLREAVAIALKWAESGIADLLPETAKDKFCDDWQKLEAIISQDLTAHGGCPAVPCSASGGVDCCV